MVGVRSWVIAAGAALLAACSGGAAGDSGEAGESDLFAGTPNAQIGQLFMIEHFGVVGAG
jgi:hypothetical protein